ncbi:RING finger protein 10 [Thrips palmi]|uniref:E3 ubiquitin-protein ligase RNF10 n=1 Tax=Thrips palmi TaxID=161013 RepID=A0A6P9A4U7_THRPL|nr:RING finger protein 10 [Thrips palmi]
MLEEIIMEKKPVRSVQPLGKGPGTDTKKGQDGAGGKTFPRSSRRRETPGASAPKYDPVRKPTTQKGKAFDKRPRPRGPFMEGRKEGPQVALEDAEYGSVISQGSKKQNLNHLLNFHYAPREGSSHQHWRHQSSGHGSGLARFFRGTPHKYNKEQFLQANCQFAVKADGDYRQYLCNPDQLVDWDLVEQIRVMSPEETSCPICLYPPVAGKMTRCGHIFCWSCILHYLALSDKTWRKCPICYESVHKRDLKSVQALKPTSFTVGGEITLRLMRRERGSLEAVPVEQWDMRPPVSLLSVSETAVDTVYAKLLLADSFDVLKIMEDEKTALKEQIRIDNDSPEVCFVEQAMEMLLEREALVKGVKGVQPAAAPVDTEEQKHDTPKDHLPDAETGGADDTTNSELHDSCSGLKDGLDSKSVRPRLESTGSEDNGTTITAEDLEHSSLQQPQKHFYFYQAADGQHIYLHAINARMLEMAYGSLDKCPLTISGRIVEKEMGSMTEDLRKRLRYMQHLPVTCQFEVVELSLDCSIIPPDILEIFQEQIDSRRRRRQKRAREEMRREKKINDEENKRLGRYPTPHIRIASHHHFPICGNESSPPVASVPKSPSVSSLASNSTQSSLSLSVENLTLDPPPEEREHFPMIGQEASSSAEDGPSFAQMLRTGKTSFSSGPAWGRRQASQPLAHSLLNVTSSRQRTASDSEPEPEGYVPAPTFSQSFSDAIAVALAKSEKSSCEASSGGGGGGGGKKKKKQKPKVLFSTSMACSGK